jgi:uncharacterized protein YraI
MFSRTKSLLASVLAVLAFTAPALASGTAAWTNRPLTIYQGPGYTYDVVGEVGGELRIYVERCRERWCQIEMRGADGWINQDYISFGREPHPPFTGPRLNYPSGGPGQVCFFTDTNYRGSSFCAESGRVARDLVLYGWDNRFASISVEGNVSVTVCRDFDFSNYCERIIESKPQLGRYIYRAVSSFHVY